ncbi:MarR family winged helix-turn-helix transcriptional regulator [Fodinicola acaciae]|uniref:MarR family winged helix-turn-helix transcriptional regulator n=1 Tax=Fodinicola acaciae TaxID=2681555 RepID=UPI0013D4F44B|nr:MarR family transcriptional regulator [Fodinicola acaciae]
MDAETVRLVRRGAARLAKRLRRERPEGSVSASKISVLGQLANAGALTVGELARRERLQPQALTRTLAALEEDELISRVTAADDRRRTVVRLTEAGCEVLTKDTAQREAWLAMAMAQELNDTEIGLLRLAGPLLERLAECETAASVRRAS